MENVPTEAQFECFLSFYFFIIVYFDNFNTKLSYLLNA